MMQGTAAARSARLDLGDDGVPRRIQWGDRSFAVTDDPTPLEVALDPALTHPIDVTGWRFQGSPTQPGESIVFDVLLGAGSWWVVHTYV